MGKQWILLVQDTVSARIGLLHTMNMCTTISHRNLTSGLRSHSSPDASVKENIAVHLPCSLCLLWCEVSWFFSLRWSS